MRSSLNPLRARAAVAAVVALLVLAPPLLLADVAEAHYTRGAPAEPQYARGVRTPVPAGAVRVEVGQSIQAAVDAHPERTTFVLASGVHREQRVVPKPHQRFIGEDGAVLSGARVLPASAWQFDGTHWFVEGQTQEGVVRGTADPGYEANTRPEDLWVGDAWYQHVLSRSELAPGRWHLDYAADRIYLAEDPATLPQIETSTTPFAFGGWEVPGVLVENVTVTRYATPSQFGAIGGDPQHRFTDRWHVRFVTVTENHAWGILMGPGMQVHSVVATRNGQGGIAGNGRNEFSGYSARPGLYDSVIAGNNVLHYTWIVEGGGTKFSGMDQGMDVVNNDVHGNVGPGIWFDIRNTGVNIESNRVHGNTHMGILYELSERGTIKWNTVFGNSTALAGGSAAAAIDVSQSSGTHVYQNVVHDSPTTIYVRYDHNRPQGGTTEGNEVWGNDVTITEGLAGMLVENAPADVQDRLFYRAGNRYHSNTFRVPAADAQLFTWGRNYEWPRMTGAEWQQMFPDTIVVGPGPGPMPAGATAWQPVEAGAR
jgi:parallel beta-helix repeat protein